MTTMPRGSHSSRIGVEVDRHAALVDRDHRPGRGRSARRATVSAVRLPVAGSTSAKTGRAPTYVGALAVAMNENDGTTTSSPGADAGHDERQVQRRRAAEIGDRVRRPAARPAKRRSNSATRGPWATQPDAITSATAAASSSPSHGCITLMRAHRRRHQRTAGRDLLAQRTPPLDELAQALLEPDLGLEAEVARARRRCRPGGGRTPLTARSGPCSTAQVGAHDPQQRLGQLEQAGLRRRWRR